MSWFKSLSPDGVERCARSPLGHIAVHEGLLALRSVLLDALWREGGNVLGAARFLGTTKTQVLQWVAVLGLQPTVLDIREESRSWFRLYHGTPGV